MNIFIFGANWFNHGDESAIRAMIDELRIKYPECKIKIQFNQAVESFMYEDIEIIPGICKPRKRQLISYTLYNYQIVHSDRLVLPSSSLMKTQDIIEDTIKWSDICVYAPGGPSIGDIYGQYQLVFMIKLMKKYGKKVFIFAVSMGPFSINGNFIKHEIDKVDVLCFREDISQKLYKQLSPEKDSTVTLDSAFQHEIDNEKMNCLFEQDYNLYNFFKNNKHVVAITVIDLNNDKHLYKYAHQAETAFKETMNYLKQKNYGIIFIPQLFGKANDSRYMKSIAGTEAFVLDDSYDCYFQQYVISKCSMVIGMRYHSNIFSAKMGTPFISIAYEHKMKGFMEMNGLEDYCIPLNDISFKEIRKRIDLIELKYSDIKSTLMNKKEELRKKSYRTSELLYDLIEDSKLCEKRL